MNEKMTYQQQPGKRCRPKNNNNNYTRTFAYLSIAVLISMASISLCIMLGFHKAITWHEFLGTVTSQSEKYQNLTNNTTSTSAAQDSYFAKLPI